ncbi:hypothetical protein BJX70DRAFT_183383 [Aspergillus crustosus]
MRRVKGGGGWDDNEVSPQAVRPTVSTTSTEIRRANEADHGGRFGRFFSFLFFPFLFLFLFLFLFPLTFSDLCTRLGTDDRGRGKQAERMDSRNTRIGERGRKRDKSGKQH